MKRKLYGLAIGFSVLGLTLVGCSDDEATNPVTTPSTDAGDASVDQTTGDSAKPDVTAPEAGPEASPDVQQEAAPPADAADVLVPETGPDAQVSLPSGEIQVLTINDFHGQLDPISVKDAQGITSYYGGLGYLSSYFKQERTANPNTIVLNGGDEIGATPTLSAYGTNIPDEPAVLGLNFLGMSASCIGNHNFDHGTAHFKKLIDIATYAYIGTNLNDPSKELGNNLVAPFKMLELGTTEKIKVAIVGISNPETPQIVVAGAMGTVTVKEPAAAANAAIVAAKAAGAHVVIVAAHLGATGIDPNTPGKPTGPLLDFVSNLSGANMVFGGHTEAEVNYKMGDTQIVQGPGRGQEYVRTKITLDKGVVTGFNVEIIPALGLQVAPAIGDSGTCPTLNCPTGYTCSAASKCEKVVMAPDPDATTLMAPWKDGLAQKFDGKIGTIDTIFVRNGVLERTQETPLGDFAADAVLDVYKPLGAQIAFMNGGGLRDALPSAYVPKATGYVRTGCSGATPCDLLLGDVYAVLPFGNAAVMREVEGSMIWQLLELSLSTYPAAHGRFLQVAGLKFVYKQSAAPGARVQSVTFVDGVTTKDIPANDTTKYKIIVNDFMNTGGDGYTMLKETGFPTPSLGILADALVSYTQKKGLVTTPPAGRITFVP